MKHLSDKVQIRRINTRCFEVYIKRSYLDSFGKLYHENKTWDKYTSRDRAIEGSNQTQSMRNCGYIVERR